MGFRERIAKRLTDVKQAGFYIPIINELPIPATTIYESVFSQATLLNYQTPDIQKIINVLRNIPRIARGKAYGEEPGRWYRVTYPETMMGAIPVVIGEGRAGAIFPRTIPKVGDINLQEIVRVVRDDFNSDYYCALVAAGARDRAKLLSAPWPLNIIWGWFTDLIYIMFYAGWKVSGWILNVLWDAFIVPQIDRVRDSINNVVSAVNIKVNEQLTQIVDAVNLRLKDLYNMWGVPTNMALTPLHIRNADETGFEFQSFGKTTAYWLAIGK